jgi:arylsulfatase A-like enzyme
LPDDLHPDNFVGNLAAHWLETYPGAEPFFLQVGFPGPHPPYDPTATALAMYEGVDVPMPILDERDLATQPLAMKALRREHWTSDHDAIVHLPEPTIEQLLRQRRHYFANVSMIDTQVGNLISALDARGALHDSVVIFTTDHGDCLNDHGHSQKWSMFEQSVHVPALVWGPGCGIGTVTSDALASLMDIGPTILELAGLPVPAWMDARTLMPIVRREAVALRPFVIAEHFRDLILTATERMTMIRDERWKLVQFQDSDEGQLFDLATDPDEIRNAWDEPSAHAIKQALIDRIDRWRSATADSASAWIEATTAFG